MNHYIFTELTIKHRKRLFDDKENPLNGWCLFIFHCINLLSMDIGIGTFVNVCLLTGCTFLSLLFFVNIRIKQNYAKLIQRRTAYWSTLYLFIRNDLNNFRFIFILNNMYGRIFASFIFVNVPSNAYLLMRIIFKHETLNRVSFIVGCTLITQQYFTIGVLHLLAAKFSTRIHRPARNLLHLMANERNHVRQMSNRIRINLTFLRLHTKKCYGFTYGNITLITMRTFTKVRRLLII